MSAVPPSYDELARWYDAIYDDRGKDYPAEAEALLALADEAGVVPGGAGGRWTVLDVACGTGRHLAALAPRCDEIVGTDLSAEMLAIARRRLGEGVALVEADVRDLALGRTFDLVTCLFSAIGHVEAVSELEAAVACMARHVAPGGLLIVEPWLTPDRVRPGGVRDVVTAETDDGVVARAASSRRVGDVIELDFAWAVAEPDGVSTHEESQRLTIFTRRQYLGACQAAGLDPTWLDEPPGWPGERGLVVASRSGTSPR